MRLTLCKTITHDVYVGLMIMLGFSVNEFKALAACAQVWPILGHCGCKRYVLPQQLFPQSTKLRPILAGEIKH